MVRSELLQTLGREIRGLRVTEIECIAAAVFDEIAQRDRDGGARYDYPLNGREHVNRGPRLFRCVGAGFPDTSGCPLQSS